MGGWTRILASTENRNVNRLVLLTRSLSSLAIASFLGIAYFAFQNKKAKRALIDRVETDGQFKASAFKLTNYKGYVVSEDSVMSGTLEKVSQMKVQNEDIFVASFPKSGTTWLQQVVYLLYNPDEPSEESQVMEWKFPYLEHVYPGLNEIENRLGNPRFIKTHLPIGTQVALYLRIARIQDSLNPTMEWKFPYLEHVYPGLNEIENRLGNRRFIKTHLPIELLPSEISKAKVLFIHRNPKDVLVSYYYFARMLSYVHYVGSLVDFAWLMMHNKLPYTPFFSHLNGYLKASIENPKTCKVVSYEEMKANPQKVIEDIATFLDIQVTPEQLEAIAEATSFEAMKANPSTNYSHWDQYGLRVPNESEFMRKGQVGDYKNHLDSQMQTNIDDWINLHCEAFPLVKSKYTQSDS